MTSMPAAGASVIRREDEHGYNARRQRRRRP